MTYPRKALYTALVLSLSSVAFELHAETAEEEGMRLYREHCRHCHDDGSSNGKYTPMTYIQAQWERFFSRKYERKHKDVLDEKFGNVAVTQAIDEETLAKISTFAIDHAADTEHPMTCD